MGGRGLSMSKGQRVAKAVEQYVKTCMEQMSVVTHMGDSKPTDQAALRVLHARRRMEAELDACFGEGVRRIDPIQQMRDLAEAAMDAAVARAEPVCTCDQMLGGKLCPRCLSSMEDSL